MAWTRAAAVAEVRERGVVDAEVGGEEIALYWVDDAVFATHNVCTHAFARLSEGFLDGDCIECPIHQAVFNVKTGEVVAPPAYEAVKTYPCRIDGDAAEQAVIGGDAGGGESGRAEKADRAGREIGDPRTVILGPRPVGHNGLE